MMKILRRVFWAAVGLILFLIAFANRAAVTVAVLPQSMADFFGYDLQATLPLYVVLSCTLLMGAFLGFFWEWFREYPQRAGAARAARRIRELEAALAATAAPKDDDLSAILDMPKVPA